MLLALSQLYQNKCLETHINLYFSGKMNQQEAAEFSNKLVGKKEKYWFEFSLMSLVKYLVRLKPLKWPQEETTLRLLPSAKYLPHIKGQ